MPLIVTLTEALTCPALGLLQGFAPSTIVTSIHFPLRVVPVAKGRLTRPELADWLSMEEPGGYWKLNEYVLFPYAFQPVVCVPVAVGVGVNVAAVPTTLISTHQDFVPAVPSPNRTPAAFWNRQ